MKKVATITFHNAANVGAILQAYALQQSLKKMRVEAELIDYRNSYIENKYSPFSLPRNDTSVKGRIKVLLISPIRALRNQRFKKFIRENINTSSRASKESDFSKLNHTYDIFFVGSDQVWNPYHTGSVDGRFFLDFVTDPRKKKSYAASFGLTNLPLEYHEQYSSLLANFSDISVREQSATSIVKSLTGNQATVVLDPVYLLDKQAWKDMSVRPKAKTGQYLLIFCVNGLTDELLQHSFTLAKAESLEIVYLASRPRRISGIKTVWNLAPKEFLGYIYNASHVVTDSFHAMSFSIIFHKDFSLQIASQHGHKNNRSLELMERIGIKGRIIGQDMATIDWLQVDKKLLAEKKRSLNYLERCLR